MYYISAGMMANEMYALGAANLSLTNFLLGNLLPVTLGNIVGGALIGVGYWFAYLKKN